MNIKCFGTKISSELGRQCPDGYFETKEEYWDLDYRFSN